MTILYIAAGLTFLILLGQRLLQYLHVLRQVRGLPTIHCGFQTYEVFFRSIIPHIPFLFPVNKFTLKEPFKKYAHARSNLIAVTQLDSPHAVYLIGSPSTVTTILTNTSAFIKGNTFRRRMVRTFGENLVSAQNGAPYKRQKDVVRDCFGEGIMRAVWQAAQDQLEVMLQGCGVEQGGVVKDVQGCMTRFTLNVFGKAGLGEDWPWESKSSKDGQMSLYESIARFECTAPAQMLLPLKVMQYSPLKRMRQWAHVQTSLLQHIDNMVSARQKNPTGEHKDVLSALVAGLGPEDGAPKLTKDEVFSDVFALLLCVQRGSLHRAQAQTLPSERELKARAGHETTANTSTFVVSFLAMYTEVQQKVYEEVEGSNGDYSDISSLRYTLNVIYGTLRHRDIFQFIPRQASRDFALTYHTWSPSDISDNSHGDQPQPVTRTHLIKAGSTMYIDLAACSMNPSIFDAPRDFRPERWDDPQLRHSFMPFAMGPRSCIGRRFAEVEMLSFVCALVKMFKITPVALAGETEGEVRKRYMTTKEKLTIGSLSWDVRLEKREGAVDAGEQSG